MNNSDEDAIVDDVSALQFFFFKYLTDLTRRS